VRPCKERSCSWPATGQVALPVALALAKDNDVWAAARFTDEDARQALEAGGVHCVKVDLVEGDLSGLPQDFTYAVNFSVMKTNDWNRDLDGNAGGVGALMNHCKAAKAFLHCSSTAVYQPAGHQVFAETAELGDNHRIWSFLGTYSISKIAAEAMVRFCARQLDLPATIARLNVPYGDNGGWPAGHLEMILAGQPIPVHPDAPNNFNPIHEQDIIAMVPKLLDVAAVPPTIVNWGGDETVSIEEWCGYLGELVGQEPTFVSTDQTIESVNVDLTRMHELVGNTTVTWRDGMQRLVSTRHPELAS